MQKARYSTHNIGHYGLAFDYYTHFTSPIRRFPDMMVHRLVTRYMDGGRSVSETKYEDLCDHSSNMEQIAANAERASIKYKQVEFMSERLGQTYDGVISGVTEWGLYVELNENKCEGMIPIRDLDDDYYEFDEKNYCLRGRRKNRIYSLGDAITVKVARANLEKETTGLRTGRVTFCQNDNRICSDRLIYGQKYGHKEKSLSLRVSDFLLLSQSKKKQPNRKQKQEKQEQNGRKKEYMKVFYLSGSLLHSRATGGAYSLILLQNRDKERT